MRFTADYDSEGEEYPVDDAVRGDTPLSSEDTDHIGDSSGEDDEPAIDYLLELALHRSPRASRDAWVCSIALD